MISKQLIQLDWQKFIREKYPNKYQQCSTNPACVSIKYRTNEHSSTHISYQLFSQAKPIVNRYPCESQSLSIADCVDWTNHQSKTSSFENFDRIDGIYSSASMNNNNNHLHLPMMFNANLQLSNNKEKKKKNKKEKTGENDDDKTKKSKVKIIEETTMDFDNTPISPTKNNFDGLKPSPVSPVQSTSIPTLSIPVPQIGGSFSPTLTSPNLSRSPSPQPSNIAHLSRIQRQLQIDSSNSYPMSVQQQLQSFAQMANDGDEILITLNINALTQKQRMNNNSTSYPGMSRSNQMMIPRNFEIVAKGFARIPHERSYSQQPPVLSRHPSTFFSPSFVPRSSMPYCSNTALPQRPLGPPIQPIILPSNPADFTSSRRNYFDNDQFRSSARAAECYHQHQLSLYKPDFRNRPFPGITKNPYLPPSLDPLQFSAKYYSERKYSFNGNDENINRTYSSIY